MALLEGIMTNWDDLRTGRYEKCKYCSANFYLIPCLEGKRFFCSYDCYIKWRKGKKAHPNTLMGLKKGVELRKKQKGKKWEEIFKEIIKLYSELGKRLDELYRMINNDKP
jgi:hypothetical protein